MSPIIFLIQEKFDDAIHSITRRCFYGVNSSTYKYNRLIFSKFREFFITYIKDRISLNSFKPLFALMGRYQNKVNRSLLITFAKRKPSEKYLFIITVFFMELQHILMTFLMTVWIYERELDFFNFFIKIEIEFQDQLILTIHSK